MTRLQKLSAYRRAVYGPGGPSLRTLRKWCKDGDLPSEKHGKCWYVLVNSAKRDTLIDRVIAA